MYGQGFRDAAPDLHGVDVCCNGEDVAIGEQDVINGLEIIHKLDDWQCGVVCRSAVERRKVQGTSDV